VEVIVAAKLANLITHILTTETEGTEKSKGRLSRSKFQTSEVSEGDIGSKIA